MATNAGSTAKFTGLEVNPWLKWSPVCIKQYLQGASFPLPRAQVLLQWHLKLPKTEGEKASTSFYGHTRTHKHTHIFLAREILAKCRHMHTPSQPKLSSCPANPQQLIEKRGYELHRKWKPLKGINEGEAAKNLCGLPISPIKLLNNGYLAARHFISQAVCVVWVCHHDTLDCGIQYWPGTYSHDQGNP